MTAQEYAGKLHKIREASKEAGRTADAVTPGMLAYVVVDEDQNAIPKLLDHILVKGLCLLLPAETFQRFGYEPPFGEGAVGFHDYVPSRFPYDDAVRVMKKLRAGSSDISLCMELPRTLPRKCRSWPRQVCATSCCGISPPSLIPAKPSRRFSVWTGCNNW